MNIVSAKCPNCGASIKIDENSKNVVCEFCNTPFVIEDSTQKYKIEVEQKIKIDGIQSEDDKLEIIKQYINIKDYKKAKDMIYAILKENPFHQKVLYYLLTMYNYVLKGFVSKSNYIKPDDLINTNATDLMLPADIFKRVAGMDKDDMLTNELNEYLKNYNDFLLIIQEKKPNELIIKRLPSSNAILAKMICYVDGKEVGKLKENEEMVYRTMNKEITFTCQTSMGGTISKPYKISFDYYQRIVEVKAKLLKPEVKITLLK